MKIIVCYKLIPEEQDIKTNTDGSLDLSKAGIKISQFDLNAIEAANTLKQQREDVHISAMSVGGVSLSNVKARKDVLSRGPDELVVVSEPELEQIQPWHTASLLAASTKKHGFDLILCGDGSADLYAQQVGLLLGEELNLPAINGVSRILSLSDEYIDVERTLEHEIETLRVPLPAVIAVSTDINAPQIPSMKSILAAGKKPVQQWSLSELDAPNIESYSTVISVNAPQQKSRNQVIIQGDGEEQIAEFAEHLRRVIS